MIHSLSLYYHCEMYSILERLLELQMHAWDKKRNIIHTSCLHDWESTSLFIHMTVTGTTLVDYSSRTVEWQKPNCSPARSDNRIGCIPQIDNTTAVAYINHLGGTVSPQAVNITRDMWMWCLERKITLKAQLLTRCGECQGSPGK